MQKINYLAASLPNELKCKFDGKHKNGDLIKNTVFTLDKIDLSNAKYPYWISDTLFVSQFNCIGKGFGNGEITPIVRSLSDLTKPITQVNYNEGEPFVPIVELAKIVYKQIFGYEFDSSQIELLYDVNSGAGCIVKYGEQRIALSFDTEAGQCEFNFSVTGAYMRLNQLQLFELLIKWHFWPNMPEGEDVVWVTNDFNPYA